MAAGRRRGEEAFERLSSLVTDEDSVDLDPEGCEIVSGSFLDGLITKLAEHKQLRRVVFVIRDQSILSKLSRIAGDRQLSIWVRSGDKQPREAPRVRSEVPETQFEGKKPAA
jgi:hypothetical protein